MPAELAAAELTLVAEPASVRQARRAIGDFAASCGASDGTVDSAFLLVSEIVTNAVIHGCRQGQASVALRMSAAGSTLRVEVDDPSPVVPSQRTVGEDDEGGRGLLLLDTVASSWGCEPSRLGKTVWFELPLR